jgi:FkbM family methyltransferase
MSRLLAEGNVVYDIGANVGYFSILSARLVGPTGTIYSFEPVPANGAAIQRNAGLNGFSNISVLDVAISDEIGERELFLAKHVGGSVLKSVDVPPDLVGSMQVNAVTIDSLVESENLRLPDVVKIDVEGAELHVLKGMRSVLEQKRPHLIVEFDDAVETICDDKYETCERYLADFNYTCASLPDSYANQGWYVRHMLARPKAA